MPREPVQKRSFQQGLENIKERMKEKRNKRLASVAAPSKARSILNKSGGSHSAHTILKGVQMNNKMLALALQDEKQKVRQANEVILQLKKEQHALFLHLLLLKRTIKEQQALAATAEEADPADILRETQTHQKSPWKPIIRKSDENILGELSPIHADPEKDEQFCDRVAALPSTVCVRRRHTTRRMSERVREPTLITDGGPVGAVIPSPVHGDSENQNQNQMLAEPDAADLSDTEQVHPSTPEPAPPKKKQQQPTRKQIQQQQACSKPEPASQKPDRGRKPERSQLKKPWENPKPRARSKSRDRSATRAKASAPKQNNKLNTSLGFNDTFDFDCEETVHVTPFKAKAEDNQPATPIGEESQTEEAPTSSKQKNNSSPSSSESEDSLYVPQKTNRRWISPDQSRRITTRRGCSLQVIRKKENIPKNQKIPVYVDEESVSKGAESEKVEDPRHFSPDSSFSNIPDSVSLDQENHQSHRGRLEDDLLPVSPLVEAEMMRIDDVLSGLGENPREDILSSQTPQKLKVGRKRGVGVRTGGQGLSLCDVTNMSPAAYRDFPSGGERFSDTRCSTPVSTRKRRRSVVVNYKEPSLNGKLRRGDKFTDVQFLRSPIFKQKSSRKTVQKSRSSQQSFQKYNESFVGCG